MTFPPEPSKECVKVSHVIFECRVINHYPVRQPCVNRVPTPAKCSPTVHQPFVERATVFYQIAICHIYILVDPVSLKLLAAAQNFGIYTNFVWKVLNFTSFFGLFSTPSTPNLGLNPSWGVLTPTPPVDPSLL